MGLPYSMNIRDIYEEIAEISDKFYGMPTNSERETLIKRLLALTYELDRRFNQ